MENNSRKRQRKEDNNAKTSKQRLYNKENERSAQRQLTSAHKLQTTAMCKKSKIPLAPCSKENEKRPKSSIRTERVYKDYDESTCMCTGKPLKLSQAVLVDLDRGSETTVKILDNQPAQYLMSKSDDEEVIVISDESPLLFVGDSDRSTCSCDSLLKARFSEVEPPEQVSNRSVDLVYDSVIDADTPSEVFELYKRRLSLLEYDIDTDKLLEEMQLH